MNFIAISRIGNEILSRKFCKNKVYVYCPEMNSSSSNRPPSMRLSSRMRPPSRGGHNFSKIRIANQNLPDQGLPSANKHFGQRQVADKAFYVGIFREKINELNDEITRLTAELDKQKRDQSKQADMEQKVAEIRKEIVDSEAELADYNVLADRIQNGTPLDNMILGFQALEQANIQNELDVNKAFKEKKELEALVNRQEKDVEELMSGKNDPEIQAIAREIAVYEQKCSDLKSSAGELSGKTREELLKMVKEATLEIGDLEKQIQNEQRSLAAVNQKIQAIENSIDDAQSERGKQYLKLLEREKVMNAFLENFQQTLQQTKNELDESQKRVFELLVSTSRDLESVAEMPTADNFKQMQSDLAYKQQQMKNTQSTIQKLQVEVESRRREFSDLDNVDQKIKNEIEQINTRIQEMEEEMPKFDDVDRQEREYTKKLKVEERDKLKGQLHNIKRLTNALATKYNETRQQVRSNEVNTKLHILEKDIRARAAANNSIKESILENKRRTNYVAVKRTAMNIVSEINSLL